MSKNNALLARLDELEKLAFRPGAHVCTECGFEFRSVAEDGSDDVSGDVLPCSKCGALCRRLSEREYVQKIEARLSLASVRIKTLDKLIEHLIQLLQATRPAVASIAEFTRGAQQRSFLRLREGIDLVLSARELRRQIPWSRKGPAARPPPLGPSSTSN